MKLNGVFSGQLLPVGVTLSMILSEPVMTGEECSGSLVYEGTIKVIKDGRACSTVG
jgi:hypothetical protein